MSKYEAPCEHAGFSPSTVVLLRQQFFAMLPLMTGAMGAIEQMLRESSGVAGAICAVGVREGTGGKGIGESEAVLGGFVT